MDSFSIEKKTCENLDSLLKYLYENHYREILLANENSSIMYIDSKKYGLLSATNLFSGFEITYIENGNYDKKYILQMDDILDSDDIWIDDYGVENDIFTPLKIINAGFLKIMPKAGINSNQRFKINKSETFLYHNLFSNV